MRKPTAATIAVTAVISAGAGATATSAAKPAPARPSADRVSIDRVSTDRVSIDRHAAHAERDRSGTRTTVQRLDRSSPDRTHGMEAGR